MDFDNETTRGAGSLNTVEPLESPNGDELPFNAAIERVCCWVGAALILGHFLAWVLR